MTGREAEGSIRHEDAELVRRAKEEREAFGALYAKYLRKVYTYVYYRVGNADDAEDITESVFLHALVHLERYQDRGIPFSAWLLRIAHNLVANWHRNGKRRRMVGLEGAEPLPDPSPSPDEGLEREAEIEALKAALRELPEERQQALILRYAEGLKHKEIGEIMGKSTGAVKVLVHRSLLSLHRSLSEKEVGR
ncbi:MAG: sigma-70 family RNA polymerase sigma factor [Actinobacteria bacterium]|nr:sigma-70 family RNA polymerase sigma factor [Actinomycetota bacterium]MDI6831389.1 sigma-70 family RNA polymerase sigma factor [Actinomycetota bacterium]